MKETEQIALSNEQIQSFHTDGYLALNAITTSAEVQRLRQSYDLLLALHTGCASSYRGELSQIDEGLKHASSVHCDELVSLPKSSLTDYIGSLSGRKVSELSRALRIALAT